MPAAPQAPVATDNPPLRPEDVEDDEEIREMRRQRDKLEDQSLATSRSALSRLRETEAVGNTTVKQLKSQGDQLRNAEGTAKEAKSYADESHRLAKDIKRHDHIFALKFTNLFNRKNKKNEKEYQKRQADIDSRAQGLHYSDDKMRGDEEDEEGEEDVDEKENKKGKGKEECASSKGIQDKRGRVSG